MTKKRVTPEEDVERLQENLWNTYGDKIIDADTFNEYYDKYLTNDFTTDLTTNQDKQLRKEVFNLITLEHKSVITERGLQRAGKERKNFPKINGKIVADGDREAGIIIKKEAKPKFTHLRYIKNKIVYARETEITFKIKDKEYTRIVYRDRLGRFTSGTKKGVTLQQVI